MLGTSKSVTDTAKSVPTPRPRRIDEPPKLSIEQWSAALHLATMWHFDAARKYAIDQISSEYTDQNHFDRVDLAMKCQVGQWLHPAYQALCERTESLSAEEGERLGYRRLTAICRIRESQARTPARQVKCGSCGYCQSGYDISYCQNPTPVVLTLDQITGAEELAVPFAEDGGEK